ncbi:MAG: hypothetical protein WDW38_006620 [Sanguina aurantia]
MSATRRPIRRRATIACQCDAVPVSEPGFIKKRLLGFGKFLQTALKKQLTVAQIVKQTSTASEKAGAAFKVGFDQRPKIKKASAGIAKTLKEMRESSATHATDLASMVQMVFNVQVFCKRYTAANQDPSLPKLGRDQDILTLTDTLTRLRPTVTKVQTLMRAIQKSQSGLEANVVAIHKSWEVVQKQCAIVKTFHDEAALLFSQVPPGFTKKYRASTSSLHTAEQYEQQAKVDSTYATIMLASARDHAKATGDKCIEALADTEAAIKEAQAQIKDAAQLETQIPMPLLEAGVKALKDALSVQFPSMMGVLETHSLGHRNMAMFHAAIAHNIDVEAQQALAAILSIQKTAAVWAAGSLDTLRQSRLESITPAVKQQLEDTVTEALSQIEIMIQGVQVYARRLVVCHTTVSDASALAKTHLDAIGEDAADARDLARARIAERTRLASDVAAAAAAAAAAALPGNDSVWTALLRLNEGRVKERAEKARVKAESADTRSELNDSSTNYRRARDAVAASLLSLKRVTATRDAAWESFFSLDFSVMPGCQGQHHSPAP